MSKTSYSIAVLPGDGIGVEVVDATLVMLDALAPRMGRRLACVKHPAGAQHYVDSGESLPDSTLAACRAADAILFGSVGLPDRDPTIPKEQRPERAALLREISLRRRTAAAAQLQFRWPARKLQTRLLLPALLLPLLLPASRLPRPGPPPPQPRRPARPRGAARTCPRRGSSRR